MVNKEKDEGMAEKWMIRKESRIENGQARDGCDDGEMEKTQKPKKPQHELTA